VARDQHATAGTYFSGSVQHFLAAAELRDASVSAQYNYTTSHR
jgi:hypothetical protein